MQSVSRLCIAPKGATTKTAAVTNRAWRAIEASLSALTLRLCLKWCGHLRFTLTGFVTCRRHETALRAVTKAHEKILKLNQFANRRISTFGYDLKFTRSPSFMPVIRR
jgi:hypothetical protein